MKKNQLVLMVILLSSMTSFAQFGTTVAGYSIENQGFKTSFAVGEVYNQRVETANFSLKNGILQPAFITSSLTNEPKIEVSIFPNPVFDFLNVDLKEMEKYSFAIFDFSGKIVQQNSLGNGKIPVTDLAKGMYVLTLISNENNRYAYKFIK